MLECAAQFHKVELEGGVRMADVTIRPSKNGPYIVEGPIELFDTEGTTIPVDDLEIR